MIFQIISTCAAVVISLAAVVGLYVESRRARFQRGVQLLLRFNDDFFGDRMRNARERAAKGIKQKKYEEVDDVLDFFETVGLLVRRRAVDELFVWHSFSYWIHRYRALTRDHVVSCRAKDATWWEDFVWLEDRLTEVAKKRLGCPYADVVLGPEDLANFIEDESTLCNCGKAGHKKSQGIDRRPSRCRDRV
jgi:hypothetical protein